MKSVRFAMVGGFLGAGKTTALGWLARHYQGQGLKVGVITNDQADNLVDTLTFRSQGLAAEEIPGGCFCCRFDALTEAAGRLTVSERPDVLLAEPVGSCTDLVATVVQPLKRLYAGQYQVAAYPVLVDPVRVRRILTNDPRGGFSPKVAYIFHKQLEEADAVVINKADTLSPNDRQELAPLIGRQFPGKGILFVSARTGEGMADLARLLEQEGRFGQHIPAVDYDTYAEGEAELGWLNATARLTAAAPFAADALLLDLAQQIREAMVDFGEIAHLKMSVHAADRSVIVNLVRGDAIPELARQIEANVPAADLVINARVHVDPEILWQVVHTCLDTVAHRHKVGLLNVNAQKFRPGRPVPTHRYAEAV